VALRFLTYGAELSATARAYLDSVLADAHLQEWIRGAGHELAAEGRPAEHP
jgi:predicted Zn-dependent protease